MPGAPAHRQQSSQRGGVRARRPGTYQRRARYHQRTRDHRGGSQPRAKRRQQFSELVKAGYYDGARFYRVVPGFVVQWGAAADPAVTKKWNVNIPDDPVKTSNTRGTVAFATGGRQHPNNAPFHQSRRQRAPRRHLGFAPIGRVTSGMAAVDRIYPGYGEQPDQGQIAAKGNAYLEKEFPRLDYIKSARIVEGSQ